MMHLEFDAPKDALIEASVEVARTEQCALITYLIGDYDIARTEISIGSAALDLPTERIHELFIKLMDLATV